MCERECDCKTCYMTNCKNPVQCGDCYTDSIDGCRSGGIHNCRGYVPNNIFKRFVLCLTGELGWWMLF